MDHYETHKYLDPSDSYVQIQNYHLNHNVSVN